MNKRKWNMNKPKRSTAFDEVKNFSAAIVVLDISAFKNWLSLTNHCRTVSDPVNVYEALH